MTTPNFFGRLAALLWGSIVDNLLLGFRDRGIRWDVVTSNSRVVDVVQLQLGGEKERR